MSFTSTADAAERPSRSSLSGRVSRQYSRSTDGSTCAPAAVYEHGGNECRTCALSADGSIALMGQTDGKVQVFCTARGDCMEFTQHARGKAVRQVAISNDGRVAASAAIDGTVRVFDTATGVQLASLRQPGFAWATGVAISADGSALVCTFCAHDSDRGRAVRFDWRNRRVSVLWQGFHRLFGVQVSSDASRVALIRQGGAVLVLEAEPGSVPREMCSFHYMKGDFDVALDASGSRVLIAERSLQLHSLVGAARVIDEFGAYRPGTARRCGLTADGARVVDLERKVVTARDVSSRRVELRMVHRYRLDTCAISADGMTVIASDSRGSLVVWRPYVAPRPKSLRTLPSNVSTGALSPSLHHVVSVPGVSVPPPSPPLDGGVVDAHWDAITRVVRIGGEYEARWDGDGAMLNDGTEKCGAKWGDRGRGALGRGAPPPLSPVSSGGHRKEERRRGESKLSIASVPSFGNIGVSRLMKAVVEIESAVEFESEVDILEVPTLESLEPEMASSKHVLQETLDKVL